jgi:diguanylate cyclase (GGDEF)-like protein
MEMAYQKNIGLQKKKILIVEDNEMNREILSELLREEFEIFTAENGEEGLEILCSRYRELSLVILDVFMPVCDGFEFLRRRMGNEEAESVPVIVATGSDRNEDEILSLKLGASDFITKPYNPEVVLGRVHSIIKLSESVAALAAVEYDELTGVYTMPAFFHYVEKILSAEPDEKYDIFAADLRNFKVINSTFGEKKGDEILVYLAQKLSEYKSDSVIARSGDRFFCFYPSKTRIGRDEWEVYSREIIDNAPVGNLVIKYGVYIEVDPKDTVSIMCDRAAVAAASIKADFTNNLAIYDAEISRKVIANQELESRFPNVLINNEFTVLYQPKVDIFTEKIVGAEALVRWIDNAGNFISPAAFIPLFEKDGLIQELDEYVFSKACNYLRRCMDSGEEVVPISVNLSRNSFFSKGIVGKYLEITKKSNVPPEYIALEITESAASVENTVKDRCVEFTNAGFRLHMDDFGTGYSSMASLSTLPFDVLKLDKSLIDQIGGRKGGLILKYTCALAKELGMKIVAEGVETQAQTDFLKGIGCDFVQGYYYSRPVSEDDFERMLKNGGLYPEKSNPERNRRVVPASPGRDYLNKYQLDEMILAYRKVFPYLRVVDPLSNNYNTSQGKDMESVLRYPCYEIWNRNERCSNCISARAYRERSHAFKFEVVDDKLYIVFAMYFELEGVPYVLEMMDVVSEDMISGISEKSELLRKLSIANENLYKDVLLGIYNRRYFEEQIDAVRNITAVAMIDLDSFKQVNDTYGHSVGDIALLCAANAVRDSVGKEDRVIRYGGDEIVVLFIGMKRENFKDRLEAIRESVESCVVEGYEDIRLTVTIGGNYCAEYYDGAIEEADKAMYEAKKEKNKVLVVYQKRM